MASVYKCCPDTPKQAARRRSPIDRLLDPALFKALAEPTRARLLACLIKCGRACSVTEVAECCSVDFSVVARHLGALAQAGVLDSRRDGRRVLYQARSDELAERFAAISGAIEEWAVCEDCGCAGERDTARSERR